MTRARNSSSGVDYYEISIADIRRYNSIYEATTDIILAANKLELNQQNAGNPTTMEALSEVTSMLRQLTSHKIQLDLHCDVLPNNGRSLLRSDFARVCANTRISACRIAEAVRQERAMIRQLRDLNVSDQSMSDDS